LIAWANFVLGQVIGDVIGFQFLVHVLNIFCTGTGIGLCKKHPAECHHKAQWEKYFHGINGFRNSVE
jgi:hypothetical protein